MSKIFQAHEEEVKKQAYEEAKVKCARNLLRMGESIGVIAVATGLTEEDIKKLR